jgi:hypothetical protein
MRITIEIDERTLGAPSTAPEILATIAPATVGPAQDGGPAPQVPAAAAGTETTPAGLSNETAATLAGVSAGAAPRIGD